VTDLNDENYLDDLLKGMENNPANFDNYAKKSRTAMKNTVSSQRISSNGFFADIDEPEDDLGEIEELDWDDLSLDEFSLDGVDADDMDFSAFESNTATSIVQPNNEETNQVDFTDVLQENSVKQDEIQDDTIKTEGGLEVLDIEKVLAPNEEVSNEATTTLEDSADIMDVMDVDDTEEIPQETELSEESADLDNLVENLLDNLDDTGSLNELEQESQGMESDKFDEMNDLDALMNSLTQEDGETQDPFSVDETSDGTDDLLDLLANNNFDEGASNETSADGEEIFSLDSMLSDLGTLEDFDSVGDEPVSGEAELTLDESDGGADATLEDALSALEEEETKGKKNKKKKKSKEKGEKIPLLKRLFGNVHDEKAAQKKEAALKAAEEKEKKKKPKKTKEELAEEKKAKDEEKKAKQEEAKKIKEAKKKEKEEKKQKKKEAQAAEEEIDEGRINRVGATIVFVFFGIIAAGIILGSKNFSYNTSIARATEFFGIRLYNEAYDEVRGVEIKSDDMEIYDKIMTVMYVNKQLNSYNNYYGLKMYPEALDALLKGLKRYDEYIDYAKDLGIQSDMDYVKTQILGELNEMFQMTEGDAYQIIDSETQEEYSRRVIDEAVIR